MKRFALVAALLPIALAACQKQAAPVNAAADAPAPVSEADAAKVADATVAAWGSMDAARIKGLYGDGIVGFDWAIGPLITDRAGWDHAQDVFAASKMDKFVQRDRKLQLLDADTFLMSGRWDGTSTAMSAHNGQIRCTDVFRRTDGKWLIVNEHCSAVPTGIDP